VVIDREHHETLIAMGARLGIPLPAHGVPAPRT
jgi:hypothetical protein